MIRFHERRIISPLTHEEVTSGEGEKSEEGQRVLEGDGVLHC